MRAETRRALRFWAIADLIYGLVLGGAVYAFLPWKTPAWNLGLMAYAGLWIVAGHFLWRTRKLGWRLGVIAAFVGLALCVIIGGGLLASWVYLHAVFGDFGEGASLGALLFVTVALQVLGLVPALALRALLRRSVREDFGAGKGWLRATVGLLTLPLLMVLTVQFVYGYDVAEPVSEAGRTQAIAQLRAAVEGEPAIASPALEGVPVGAGELFVSLWKGGKLTARITADGADLAEAITKAGKALAGHPKIHGRTGVGGQLKVDRIVATAPVPFAGTPVVSLSVNPGLDGLRRLGDGLRRTLLPDDLLKKQRFAAAPLVPGINELRLGLDAKRTLADLGLLDAPLERFRTESWVEFEGRALPVMRGNTPPSGTGPDAWRQAAIEGGHFIVRQIKKSGQFHYQYYPLADRHPKTHPRNYSLPRHAGTVYALALLQGLTGEAAFTKGAKRAIQWLVKRIPKRCGTDDRACVVKGETADLGSTALTLVGMLEYRRRTGEHRYDATIRRLASFVLWLQRPDGDFHHIYTPKTDALDTETRKMFFSEEAALALVMTHEAFGDAVYIEAAERALDYLTQRKYAGYFLGQFIYGADHWTCIAADEAYPRLKRVAYLDFCEGYAGFIRRLQFPTTGWANSDFAGHYGFTGLMVPQAAAAGFTEAVISTYTLGFKHGRPSAVIRQQAADALDALAREQVRADNAWMMPRPAFAKGAIRRSLVEQEVRIDFTQHAASALIRGAQMPPMPKDS